jgi:hypothetical protein
MGLQLFLRGLLHESGPAFAAPSPQEAKLKAKKAKAWQERLSKQAEQQAAKQQK